MHRTMDPETRTDAFRRFYDEHFHRVYNYLFYRTGGDRATAEDLCSDAFRKALEAMDRYSGDKGSERAWICSIAANALRDHLRRKTLRGWLGLDLLADPAGGETPEAELERDESLARLSAAMAPLGTRERELLALKFGMRLDNREIARQTGLSETNVGTILYRALGRLKAALSKETP